MISIALLAAAITGNLPRSGERFIERRLGLHSFRAATVDLNGDGTHEIVAYATDPEQCGSGGCTLYVLAHRGGTYRIVMRSTIVHLPVRLLATKSYGWRDIGVTVSGGGIQPYTARMRFNGEHYPTNPTTPPAVRVGRSGKVLISR